MSRKRTPRRVRPLTNPLLVALDHASTLTPAELQGMLTPIRSAFDALRRGQAAERDWCLLAGSLGMAQTIERQGVVRGLHEHLQAAEGAMTAIERRATAAGPWRAPTLHGREIEAIDAFVDLHAFQLRQLSYAEFRRAYLTTEGQVRSRGAQVVRESEVEHV